MKIFKILISMAMMTTGTVLICFSLWISWFVIQNSKHMIPPLAFVGMALPGVAGMVLIQHGVERLRESDCEK